MSDSNLDKAIEDLRTSKVDQAYRLADMVLKLRQVKDSEEYAALLGEMTGLAKQIRGY